MDNVKQNLREFRIAKDMGQEELGEYVGVTRQTIGAWEKGESTPTVAQLFKVADALGVLVDSLLFASGMDGEKLLFRADNSHLLTPQIRALLTERAKDHAYLEQLLGEISVVPESRPLYRYDPNRIEKIAKEIREWLGLGERPVDNAFEVLEDKGIKVLLWDLPNDVSGCSAFNEEMGGVVFVNRNHPLERQFFTAFHELAHMIFHRREYTGAGALSKKKTQGKDPKERIANHFAGAVLLPKNVVYKELGPLRKMWIPEVLLRDIKVRYKVSMRTILLRAEQTGLITSKQMGQQLGTLMKKYGRYKEPGTLVLPKSYIPRSKRLTFAAFLRSKITLSRAAEILQISLVDMRHELEAWTDGVELGDE